MVLVGSPLGYTFNDGFIHSGGAIVVASTALSEPGANVSSPVSGLVVRWTTKGRYQGGPFRLRILRPTALGLVGAGTSGPQTPVGESAQSYSTALPIQAGDLIGVEATKESDLVGIQQPATGAAVEALFPPPLEGSPAATTSGYATNELGLNATVQAAPEVQQISPTTGPIAGGTSVTIAGGSFESVTSVDFGGTPAASFEVNSDKSIVASSPSAQAGPVSVSVTTIAGTTTAPQKYNYVAPAPILTPTPSPISTFHPTCKVPKLQGKTLKSAKKRIRSADCRVGKLTKREGATAKDGEVVKQVPKPGKTVPATTKVKLTLAP